MNRAVSKLLDRIQPVVDLLNGLKDTEETIQARKLLSNLVAGVTASYGTGDGATYDILIAPNSSEKSLSLRKQLTTNGITSFSNVRTNEDVRVYLLQAHPELLPTLLDGFQSPTYPALLKIREGDIDRVLLGATPILNYFNRARVGAPTDIDKLERERYQKQTQDIVQGQRIEVNCALSTKTKLTKKKKCCGNKTREIAIYTCPYHRELKHDYCMNCTRAVPKGGTVSPELQHKIKEHLAVADEKQRKKEALRAQNKSR